MEPASAKELFILGRISRRPTHGHEIMRTLRSSRADLWVDLSEKHVYYVLKKLERDGLIERAGEAGARRRVYAITASGRERLARLLQDESLTCAAPYSEFDVVFGMLCSTDVLDDASRDAVIERRRLVLERAVSDAVDAGSEARADAETGGLPLVMMEKIRRLATAELEWLDDVRARIAREGWASMSPVSLPSQE